MQYEIFLVHWLNKEEAGKARPSDCEPFRPRWWCGWPTVMTQHILSQLALCFSHLNCDQLWSCFSLFLAHIFRNLHLENHMYFFRDYALLNIPNVVLTTSTGNYFVKALWKSFPDGGAQMHVCMWGKVFLKWKKIQTNKKIICACSLKMAVLTQSHMRVCVDFFSHFKLTWFNI